MKKISKFLSENFLFFVVKFSIYLNRRVFVMKAKKKKMNPLPQQGDHTARQNPFNAFAVMRNCS